MSFASGSPCRERPLPAPATYIPAERGHAEFASDPQGAPASLNLSPTSSPTTMDGPELGEWALLQPTEAQVKNRVKGV